jgi:RNA polymerase sigma-70 factor (ECF subfamily)
VREAKKTCIRDGARAVFRFRSAYLEGLADTEIRQALAESAQGDRQAFARLIRAHQAMVFSQAYHSTGDAAEAEELSQDVFLELFRNLGSIETPAHLTYWLRKVASRKCIDWARRDRKRPKIALENAPEPAVAAGVADTLLSESLRKLVASLPEPQKTIVILRFQEEMEPSEIAGLVGIPVNTVKSNLHRALQLLRDKLERSGRVVSR